MFKYWRTILIFVFILMAGLFLGNLVMAQNLGVNYAGNLGLANADPRTAAVNVIKIALTFLGIIAIVMILYGGFVWMTAAGDPGRVEKAKKILISAIIGLIIILSAFLIVQFIFNKISGALTPTPCTTGDVRPCSACEGAGTQTCTAGAWGACSTACTGLDACCPWGCWPDCSTPPPFYVKASSPADNDTNVIRNAVIKYTFNRALDQLSVDNTTFIVEDATGPPVIISGALNINNRKIEFTPIAGTCPTNPCGATSCFPANSTIQVTIDSTSAGVVSFGDGISMDCGVGPCDITFTVGDQIDCQDPTIDLSFGQICASPANILDAAANDDSGITNIEFYDPAGLIIDQVNPTPMIVPFITSTVWDGAAFPPNTNITLHATAYDMDANSQTDTKTVKLRPAHCCNGVLDAINGEVGIDCGGECAVCAGEACGISKADACDAVPTNCDDSFCSSGFCNCGNYGVALCQSKGYDAGIDYCCICEDNPIIDWVTPVGGFCDDDVNMPCINDSDCGTTCNTDTPNGAVGNFVTVGGRYFGNVPGTITFCGQDNDLDGSWCGDGDDAIAALANDSAAGNPSCGSDSDMWKENQIIVVVPAGAIDGPIQIIEAVSGNNFSDASDDGRGPVLNDFVVNTIGRPGLCSTTPISGLYTDSFHLEGKAFTGGVQEIYFGNINKNILAENARNWADASVDADVPNADKGKTSIFAAVDNITSNYLNFWVLVDEDQRPVIDYIDPGSGPIGGYITIYGSRFGSYDPAVSEILFDGSILADGTDFPEECRDRWWQDTYIIVKVPTGLVVDNSYAVTATNRDGLISDPEPFTVDPGMPGPGLCLLKPTNGPVGQAVIAYGDNFGDLAPSSFVRFFNNIDDTIFDAGEWGNQKIDTQVPAGAVTGPVEVSDGMNNSNSLPFIVGYCNDNSDCQTGDECCGPGTFWQGICRLDGTCSDSGFSLTGFGWSFTTATTGPLNSPCYHATTSPLCTVITEDCSSDPSLACDPNICTCQIPCGNLDLNTGVCANPDDLLCTNLDEVCNPSTCFCVSNNQLSCVERSIIANNCPSGQFCGNSPGQCSFFDNAGIATTSIGAACNDSSCTSVTSCTSGNCTYDSITNSCIDNNQPTCDVASITLTTDILGNPITAYCAATSSDLIGRWQINTSMSCPLGWTRPVFNSNVCYQIGSTCQLCDSGFGCIDDGAGSGICAAGQKICPPNSWCESQECVKEIKSDCECCCRLGFSDEDCCSPLDCLGDCGEDRIADSDVYGYCSGCRIESAPGVVDQAASDAACNCVGSTGKFCDADADVNNDGVLDGVCRDCGQLKNNVVECGLHDTVCCIDAKNSDYCRSGAGNLILTDPGYCAYYDCQAPPNQYFCDITPITTGAYADFNVCGQKCMEGTDICDLDQAMSGGDCDGLDCFAAFNCFDNSAPGSGCGFCCCDMIDDQCYKLSSNLYCEYTNFGNCDDPIPGDSPAGDDFGVCCGCAADDECGDPNLVGCGEDSCCYSRPVVNNTAPNDNDEMICRNALISAEFDQSMDLGSFSGNMIVAVDYGSEPCPQGTTYLAFNPKSPQVQNKIIKILYKLRYLAVKALSPILPARLARAYTAPDVLRNYCAVTGKVSGFNQASGESVIEFSPQDLLAGDQLYYAIILGDENLDKTKGVRSVMDIGMNGDLNSPSASNNTFNNTTYARAYIWSFRTLSEQAVNNGICDIDHVKIDPAPYLFKTTKDDFNNEVDNDSTHDTFDTARDSDKVFTAHVYGARKQKLSPVTGYAWEWNWSVDNLNIVAEDQDNPYGAHENKRLYEAQPKTVDGTTNLHASINLTEDTYSNVGNGETGTARVQVFVCDNPWPPIATDGTWMPWQDNATNCLGDSDDCHNTNYELYYCRDSGKVGTYDDLPAIISSSTIIRGEKAEIMKEAYFFREATPSIGANFTAVNTLLAQTGGSVDLSWSVTDSEIDDFILYWGKSSGNYTNNINVGNFLSTTTTGFNNNMIYYFNLTAYYDTGAESEFFGEILLEVKDETAPNLPASLTAMPGEGEVELSWASNAIDVKSYEVYYGSAAGVYGYSQNIGLDTAVIIAGLTNGHSYYFAVRAIDASDNMSGYAEINNIIPFAAPTNLTAIASSTNNAVINLKWDLDSTAVDQTNVYWGVQSGIYPDNISIGGAATSSAISGLSANTTYYFVVTSEDANGIESASSSAAWATTVY
ncbi:MAG: Ig-like domain-containing protein [Patescibacteria group bacterium]|nr:Ig-like domain-containing protein [Patescibacteria group bacterium]